MFASALWDFIGKFSNQILAFIISVILARLLSPVEFGQMSVVLVFIYFSTTLFDLGFKNAIINTHQISEEALSTILSINLLLALLFGGILFFTAGKIALFYKEPVLEGLLKASTVLFLINAAAIVPTALNHKNLKFKVNAKIIFVSTCVSGILSIWMAYSGYGVWSIIGKSISQALITCILSWVVSKYVPKLYLNINTVKPIASYSLSMFITVLLDSAFQRVDTLLLGKRYDTALLGYYTRAQTLEAVPRDLSTGIMYSIFFPYFSKIKDKPSELRLLYIKCLSVICFLLLLINGILFLNSKEIVLLLFGEKWILSVFFFRMFLVIGFFFVVNAVTGILIASSGEQSLFLKMEFSKKLLFVPTYIVLFYLNVSAFMVCLLLSNVGACVLGMYFIKKNIHIGLKQQLATLLWPLITCLATVLVVSFLFRAIGNIYLRVCVSTTCVLAIYCISSKIIKNKGYTIIAEHLQRQLKTFRN